VERSFDLLSVMTKVPAGLKKSASRRKPKQRRSEQMKEAEEIMDWLFTHHQLGLDLSFQIANRFPNKDEAAVLFVDLMNLSYFLTSLDEAGMRQKWECYSHHFVGDQKRRAFFSQLENLARRVAQERLSAGGGGIQPPVWAARRAAVSWDDTLMPSETAPYLVRVATLHPGVLQEFLTRFFVYISDLHTHRSTFWRAFLILSFVPDFGWSAEKHTRKLLELNAIKPSEDGCEVEMVKKFIRDLRQRYRKYLRIMGPSSARLAAWLGTQQAQN
jgi:hypothetical protein